MYKNETCFFLQKQLLHWKERASCLEAWLKKHSYEHPSYSENASDYRAAKIKIESLTQRLHRARTGYVPECADTVSTQGLKNAILRSY